MIEQAKEVDAGFKTLVRHQLPQRGLILSLADQHQLRIGQLFQRLHHEVLALAQDQCAYRGEQGAAARDAEFILQPLAATLAPQRAEQRMVQTGVMDGDLFAWQADCGHGVRQCLADR